jgi:hypothetical protein
MATFSYTISDLARYESDLVEVPWESEDQAVSFGSDIAREMLERMPQLASRGWSISVYDSRRKLVSVVPIAAVC